MHLGVSPRVYRWAALSLLALAASALAQQAENTYTISENSASQASTGWTLNITGDWPTQCPPTLEKVSLEGNDLRVDARSELSLCTRRTMPFSIELNPALAVQDTPLVPGIYHVSFFAADGAQAPPKLRAFTLVDHSAPDAAPILPEAGFWWTANPGDAPNERTVLSLELQDGQLSAALMSYDNLGQPVWYFGAATFGGHIAHVPLLRLAGGSDPFTPAAAATPQGDAALTLDLQFESGAHALAWLSRTASNGGDTNLQLREFDFVRLPLADASTGLAWQGDWVLVADSADVAPERVRLEQYRALDAQHFELSDSQGSMTLSCTREASQPEWPPSSCALRQADNTLTGTFDSVALGRMDGVRSEGGALHLLRVAH